MTRYSLCLGFLSGLCVFGFSVRGSGQDLTSKEPPTVDHSRFEVTALATGLVQPMELAVAPDGSVYFIELSGKLQVFDPATRRVQLVGELTVTTAQENGLIGLALDPHFDQNRWIYLQYSPPEFPGQQISRFTIIDGRLDLASEKVLLRYEEQRKECCHHAGSLQFGPRGELFIATGDNTHPHGDSQGYAPLDERPERAPYDAQKSSSNTSSYNGKILRIRPTPEGGYEIPEGNLFPADGSAGRPEIYVMGCRNPWRISVDPQTGFLYWGDVGPDAGSDGPRGPKGYDEINLARRAGNFGWPYFIANNLPYADVNFATGEIGPLSDVAAPRNESPNNTGLSTLPKPEPALLYYPYGASSDFPELGAGGRTACAGPVYHYSASTDSPNCFPAEYDRSLFIFEWSRHWIKVVHFDDDHQVKRIETLMPDHRFVRPIDLQFGSDGALYILEYGETWGVNADARLLRIDYLRGNRAPVAKISVENNFGKQPLSINASSKGTFDKDEGDTLSYEWRVVRGTDPAAKPALVSTEMNPVITIEEPGIYNLELTVADSHGAFQSVSAPAVVGNQRPLLRFLKPCAGEFFDADQPIAYELVVRDEEDGTNADVELDERAMEPLDADSPKRISLTAEYSDEPISVAGSPLDESTQGPMGLRRMKGSDCFNCHAVDQKRVGPPLLEIANKYRGIDGAIDLSIQRVLKGSTGVWGKIPMIPHSQHSLEDIREMVSYIYRLESKGLVRVFDGFVGEIPVKLEEASKPGHYRLIANYTDRGAGVIPPLTTSAEISLRSRLVEAETANQVRGPQLLGSSTAGGGKFVGAINDGHFLKFEGLSLDRVSRLTFRVASAGAGGTIEVRLDRPDGELLASADVEVNGHWEQWYERSSTLKATQGQHDLYILFIHPQQAGGLMNLDSIHFHR